MYSVAKRTHVRVRQDCRSCGRLHTSESRSGLWFTCKYCGEVQPGPGLAQATAAATSGRRRRRTEAARVPEEISGRLPELGVETAAPARRSATRYWFGGRS